MLNGKTEQNETIQSTDLCGTTEGSSVASHDLRYKLNLADIIDGRVSIVVADHALDSERELTIDAGLMKPCHELF